MRINIRCLQSTGSSATAVTHYRIRSTLDKPNVGKVHLQTSQTSNNGPRILKWYTCGPTVYDAAHLGHATCYLRLDIIRRILERNNDFSILQVMNITNIDDKILNRAKSQSISWDVLSKKYEAEFLRDLDLLNVKRPHAVVRVTDFMPDIIKFISVLMSKGLAYSTPDSSVYFDCKAFGNQSVFVKENADQDQSTRKDELGKKHGSDFCLWKGQKPNEPYWDTPWGKGRPGWHIECSAIAGKFFGSELDIHAGGCDLIFPHHENEEIQCRAYYGINQWVKHWLHTGHMIINQDKMSKSLGNTVSIESFLKDHSADVLRMLCMNHYYRSHLYFSDEEVRAAKANLDKVQEFLSQCDLLVNGVIQPKKGSEGSSSSDLWTELENFKVNVDRSLSDDFDYPSAKSLVFDYMRKFNSVMLHKLFDGTDYALVLASKSFVSEFMLSLGFNLSKNSANIGSDSSQFALESVLDEMVGFRNSVRNFALAFSETDEQKRKQLIGERGALLKECDTIRVKLKEYGLDIKDHKMKSSWSIKLR